MEAATPRTAPDPRRWWALALLCGAFFMVILDAAIVTVALPSIEQDLGFSAQGLQWVVSAYALTFAGLLLLGGRAADLLGRRRVFMVGLVLFTLASLLCGLAWSDTALIGARAFQGIGAAVMTPSALSIITTTFEEGAGAQQGARDLGRARRHRRDDRLADRRSDRRRPRLGVDLLHQHPRRARRARALSCPVAGEPGGDDEAKLRPCSARSRSRARSSCSSTQSSRRPTRAGETRRRSCSSPARRPCSPRSR